MTIDCAIRGLYARANMIKRKFYDCTEDVKLHLFRSYCSNFYCCALWSGNDPEPIKAVKICHNNVLRMFIQTRFKDSISGHFMVRNLPNLDVLRRNAALSLYKRLTSSQNILVTTIVQSSFFIYSEFLAHWKLLFN